MQEGFFHVETRETDMFHMEFCVKNVLELS
jgi:hypothetical protein